ncbi:MAG: hypothetical protein NZ519_02650 [Bacteroidia bacterium]|nr:hypothetical protein [Bacteroidia bacterium]
MIKIANPAYDVVFKYLMEDVQIAKILLSDLLQEEIIDLQVRPQEYILDVITTTVYRLDFNAKIKNTDGTEKIVLVEIQKAKFPTDILRFRRYLGEQYRAEQNLVKTEKDGFKALPIITVYFLGYPLSSNPPYPVLRVRRNVTDNSTQEVIDIKDEFIESLTHDCVIVQIPKLKETRRNELEMILSLFDEREYRYEISVNEEDYPERYRGVIRRLLKAAASEELRKSMEIEDEIIESFKVVEREKERLEEELKRRERELEQERVRVAQEKQRAEEEKQKAEQKERELEQEKQRAEQEKQRAEQEKQRAEQLEQDKINMIREMLKQGFSKEIVMQIAKVDELFLKKHNLI